MYIIIAAKTYINVKGFNQQVFIHEATLENPLETASD